MSPALGTCSVAHPQLPWNVRETALTRPIFPSRCCGLSALTSLWGSNWKQSLTSTRLACAARLLLRQNHGMHCKPSISSLISERWRSHRLPFLGANYSPDPKLGKCTSVNEEWAGHRPFESPLPNVSGAFWDITRLAQLGSRRFSLRTAGNMHPAPLNWPSCPVPSLTPSSPPPSTGKFPWKQRGLGEKESEIVSEKIESKKNPQRMCECPLWRVCVCVVLIGERQRQKYEH